ncbi:MAG: hypothetical protein JWP35_2228 [Caulobacter sp.]|nr:hypothetical protein [Caulobacter sp.]
MSRRDTASRITPENLALGIDMADRGPPVARTMAGPVRLEARLGRDALWIVARWSDGREDTGLALRTAWTPGQGLCIPTVEPRPDGLTFKTRSPMGLFQVDLIAPDPDRPLWRCITRLTPDDDLSIPYWPRDLYPLDAHGDPAGADAEVLAAQRGLNAGVLFLALKAPVASSVLYFQNFSALNDYFRLTKTKPDGVVGGVVPELGYQPPTSGTAEDAPRGLLPAGRAVTISDALIALDGAPPADERASALTFLTLLADIYRQVERPATVFRDWRGRARRTLLALERSPKITGRHYGHTYIRPYVNAENPDSMVQLAVALPLADYARWRGKPLQTERALRAGVPKFFDPELGTIRRYLPDVAKDKDKNEVDSWYLYHPLANLGRYADQGDEEAKQLFFGSLDYAIKVARHFKYDWPVLFNVETLEVNTATRGPGMPGQSDVGGLYAYVMLQAYELSGGEARYLAEAKKAVQAMKGMRFDLLYQTNLTAWGAMACLKLHQLTGEEVFLGESYVLFAGFFHNTIFWESDIERAAHYQTFLGATCLHDGPYMAIYECFESFDAFRDYLHLAGDAAPEPLRLLICEYGRYALSRAWGFYPDALPADILATKIRNGEIDRNISIPVEDLYADGQPVGQVGQEVYGCGAAFVFAMRSFHRLGRAPFQLFCDYPLNDVDEGEPGVVTFRPDGARGFTCRMRLIPPRGGALPAVKASVDGKALRLRKIDGMLEATLPAQGEVRLTFEP